MNYVIFMHVSDALANLSHKEYAILFGEREIVRHDSFEEFSSRDAEKTFENLNQITQLSLLTQ